MAFIEKEAKDPARFSFPRRFTSSARAALTHILGARASNDARGVLLPSYVGVSKTDGSGVFDPVRRTGIAYAFYRVDERLVPDVSDIAQQLKTGRFQFVLLIHYFGWPQLDAESLARLCHAHGALLIEDCAHTLPGGLPEPRPGSFGDYAIFSIHKSAPTVDGGFYDDWKGDLSACPLAVEFAISSATLEAYARIDLVSRSRAMVRNYDTVEAWVREMPELTLLFPSRMEGTVPLNCPVLVRNGRREALYFSLIEHGIVPTALYHTLIPEILRSDYPEAHFLSDNILNLPTHADIPVESLEEYGRILRQSVREVFAS